MTPRSRSRTSPTVGYSQLYFHGAPYGAPTPKNSYIINEVCDDIIGDFGKDHTFNVTKYDATGCNPCEGVLKDGGSFDGTLVVNDMSVYPTYASFHLTTKTLATVSRLQIANRTNPNRPDVTPLTLLQDLYDMPRMLKDVGKLARTKPSKLGAKDLANQNLAVQFGWLPLITDVRKLLQTQSRVEKRFKRLRKLYDTGGEHRKFLVDEDHVELFTPRIIFESGTMGSAYMNRKSTTHATRWATARYSLSHRAPHDPSYEELQAQAWKVANGLTPEGLVSGLWDVIPWTWLVDWFTNAGDFVTSLSNTIPVTLESACIMTQTETTHNFTYHPDTSKWWTNGGGNITFTTKNRTVPSVTAFTASLPTLGLREVSILGSLFIQRFLR